MRTIYLSKNLKRWSFLGTAIALLTIPPSLPWKNFWLLRLLSPIGAIALTTKSIGEAKKWEREAELSAMRWQAHLAKEEEILQVMVAEVVPELPQQATLAIESSRHFNWEDLRTKPNLFPHLRIIGKTGSGKTVLADWLLDILGGERFVITPKKKPHNWQGLEVVGCYFDYDAIRVRLERIREMMYSRFDLIDRGEDPGFVNFIVDEWRLIATNIKAEKTEDGERMSAKDIMREIITVAREANMRMIALAQGEQVRTWGLEGESDVGECFTSIRIGQFAVDHARSLQKKLPETQWNELMGELERQGHRCCMVDDVPARIPDLSKWGR